MKIVQINVTCGSGSTGKICVSISKMLTQLNIENYILYSGGESKYPLGHKYMSHFDIKLQALKSRVLGNYGFNSTKSTKRLIKILNQITPDVIHLHNMHGHNCDLEVLFKYIKEHKIKLFWTFHDCWAFTGYCTHYDMVGCRQWQDECKKCIQKKSYSWFFDRSNYVFKQKKELFDNLDLTIISPSKWMDNQIKSSFFSKYETKVINNGIDVSVFCPQESNFREKYNCENKHVVLGVAFDWGIKKGLDVFKWLSHNLNSDYQIVLVGTNHKIDKDLPNNIISIHRTVDQMELAKLYTMADVFVNPTREEVFGLVNIEALACGTPVVTFNSGGCSECIDELCGVTVKKDDLESLKKEIIRACENDVYLKEDCIKRASQYIEENKYKEYVRCYTEC